MSECPFVPPKPPILDRKPGVWARIGPLLRSNLSLFRPGSYDSLGMSRYAIPTLPGRPKRWCYAARDPEVTREILVERPGDFPKSTMMAGMLGALTGQSIFTTNGEVWRRQRDFVDPALAAARVRESFGRMRQAADAALAELTSQADGREVRIDEAMTRYAADIIFRTLFSEPLDARSARQAFSNFEVFQSLAYAYGMVGLSGVSRFLFPGYLPAVWAGWRVRRVMEKPLDRRLKRVREGGPAGDDILGALISMRDDQGKGLTKRELLDQIAMLFLAGHETSAAAAGWALYLIAASPDIQTRMRAEVAAVAGDGPLEFQHLKRLPLVADVFREALRLYPPVTFVARDATSPERMLNRDVQQGDVVFLSAWMMHRHADLWDQPDAFDPDRFETAKGRQGLKRAFMPFSLGPRVCPGAAFALQEGVLILAMVVRAFSLSVAPGPEPEPRAKLTLRSANGIRLLLEPLGKAGSIATGGAVGC